MREKKPVETTSPSEGRHVLEVLQESGEGFRLLADASPDLLYQLDLDGILRYCSPASRGMLGYEPGEVIGNHFRVFLAPEALERATEVFGLVSAGEPVGLFELCVRKKDGSTIPVEFHMVPVRVDGSIVGLQGSARDVSARVRAERELRESEAQWRSLTESSPDHILLVDRDLVIRFINHTVPPMKRKDIVGTTVCDYYPGEKRHEIRRVCEEILETGRTASYGTQYTMPDGTVLHFESRIAARKVGGEVVGLVISSRNITRRVEAERAVRESEIRYRNLIDNSIVGVIQSSVDGEILFANNAMLQMAGFESLEDMIADGAHSRYRDPGRREEWIRGLQRDGRVDGFEAETLDRHGNARYGHFSAVLYGGVITTVAIDITDRRMMEEQLRRSRQELRDLSVHLRDMREKERAEISGWVHDELGQTLTALQMNLSRLKKKLQGEREDLVEEVKEMEGLVLENLRAVQRVSNELRPRLLDDLGLLAAVEWHSGDFEKRTGIRCRFVPEPAELEVEPELATDLFRLYQEAMTNIYRHADAGNARIEVRQENGSLTLDVRDDGVGIARGAVENPLSYGIQTMKERVQRWGGEFVLERTDGGGTRLRVTIPRESAKRA